MLLILCLFSSIVHATKLTWIPPNQYTNGDPLPLENIKAYRLSYDCGTPKTLLIDGNLTSYNFTEIGFCTVSLATIDVSKQVSGESNSITINTPIAPILEIPDHIQVCLNDPNCKVLLTSEWQ